MKVHGNKGKHHSEEAKRKMSQALIGKVAWNRGKKLGPRSEETKKKLSLSNTGHAVSEEARKKIGEAHRGMKHSIETRLEMARTRKGRICSEETRRRLSVVHMGRKRGPQSKEHRRKLSVANIGKKQSQETIKKRFSKTGQRPNNFEQRCGQHLEKQYPNCFKYVGDASIMVCDRSCDFLDIDNKVVVLCHGIYYHWKKFHPGVRITEADRRSVEKIDSTPFISAGYKVIFIWEDELK